MPVTTPISIISVQCGQVTPFRGADEPSAIDKRAVTGQRRIHLLGIEGDAQADLTVHGGPEKAIHHYPHDHYDWWRATIGEHPLLDQFGAFGENISTEGLTESDVCIGDRWRLGTAVVEVSQGRQPCWKLDHRFGGARVNAACVQSRRSGWYYRVIEEGAIEAGDTMELLDRPFADWTVRRVFDLLVAGEYKSDRAGLEDLGEVRSLAEPWKVRRARLLDARD